MPPDFLQDYRDYTAATIVPRLYNEWAAISAVSSLLTRQCWVERGYYLIYPNVYAMLIGDPGTGKGTAIAILQKIMEQAGFTAFAPDRTTKEKFLVDLEEGFNLDSSSETGSPSDTFFTTPMFNSPTDKGKISDVFILAEEVSDFFGSENLDFVSLLTKLWSYEGTYQYKIKTGRSVKIPNPCINMLAGTTPDSFQLIFPSRLLGTGFLARFILIYGSIPGDNEVAYPAKPDYGKQNGLSEQLVAIKNHALGLFTINGTNRELSERMLINYKGPNDPRFVHYRKRRFTQLLKLAMIHSAARQITDIQSQDLINANTLLYATEQEMSKALGEFGKSRNSEIANKIMQALYATIKPMDAKAIFRLVATDLTKPSELTDIINNLTAADKIKYLDKQGYIAKQKPIAENVFSGEVAKELLNQKYLDYLHGGDGK